MTENIKESVDCHLKKEVARLKIFVYVISGICVVLLIVVSFLMLALSNESRSVSSDNISTPLLDELTERKRCRNRDHRDAWIDEENAVFLQISDTHYDPFYKDYINSTSLCRNVTTHVKEIDLEILNATTIKRYGRFGCDSPLSLIEVAVAEMSATRTPRFILFTGDILAHKLIDIPSLQEEELMDVVLRSTSKVLNTVSARFEDTPIFPIFGNNDGLFHYISPSLEFAELLADIWEPLITSSGSEGDAGNCDLSNLARGLYYSCRVREYQLVIALNTILWNARTPNIEDGLLYLAHAQLSWFNKTLSQAQSTGSRVLVTGHIPPGIDLNRDGDVLWAPEYYDIFVNIVDEYSSIITGGIFSHTHTDDFHILYTSSDAGSGLPRPVGTVFLSPPISVNWGDNNPGFREWLFDDENFELQDYKQRTLDIDMANMYPDHVDGSMWSTYRFRHDYQNNDQSESLNTSAVLRASLGILGSNFKSHLYLSRRHSAHNELSERMQFVQCNLGPEVLIADDYEDCLTKQLLLTDVQLQSYKDILSSM